MALPGTTRPIPTRSHRWVGSSLPGLVLLGLGALPAAGQTTDPVPAPIEVDTSVVVQLPADPLEKADELYFDMEPVQALTLLEAYLGRRPDDYRARWRAARAALSLGQMAGADDRRAAWYTVGLGHARRATELSPDAEDGLIWKAAASGWLAILGDGWGERMTYADESWTTAQRLQELAPDRAETHSIIGSFHHEGMSVSGFLRYLGRVVLGIDVLGDLSWEKATTHLERAVELDPSTLLFRLDLARHYVKRDRPDDAREQLRALLGLDPVHPADPLLKDRARTLLEELENG